MTEINNEQTFKQTIDAVAKIKVVGVGGGGNNTIHSMIRENIEGVDFIVANTDEQVLNSSICKNVLRLGNAKKGLGAGADPEKGRVAAVESTEDIKKALEGADMVIIAAGMGGGTGTGASPIIAKIAKELGALTVGIVTTPFSFEGSQRAKNSIEGLKEIKSEVDSLIVVSNDKLLKQFGGISLKDSFVYADKTLKQTVRTITDLIAIPALINLDFSDVTTIMKDKGTALIGIGKSTGEDRAIKAATHAISSPILEASIRGASNAIINVSGGDITLDEANKAVETIKAAAGSELNIIFGVSIVDAMEKEIQVSVIATGIEDERPITEEQIKKEASDSIKDATIEFENEKTREFLITDPLPEDEKLSITDEVKLQNSPFDILEEDDDDIPEFLRS